MVDPNGLARSLPGVGTTGGPVIVATMGRPGRFPNPDAFKAFTGLTPRASQTGVSDRKGHAMTKAGPRRLRDQLVQSANTARKVDPQLAAVYWSQMVERGAHHTKAVCVVAARLAARAHAAMTRGEPYVIRDLDGRPVTTAEAREIIAANYQVPEHVRRRRRAQQGKAPQAVPQGTAHRGDLPHRNSPAHFTASKTKRQRRAHQPRTHLPGIDQPRSIGIHNCTSRPTGREVPRGGSAPGRREHVPRGFW